MSVDHAVRGDIAPAMQLDAISSVARVLLNTRLVAGLLCVAAFAGRQPTVAEVSVVLGVMAVLLVVLLCWNEFGPLLVRHPAFVAGDVALMYAALAVLGVDSPFYYAIIGSAALVGLCLGFRGARFFSPVFLCGWYAVVWLNPPAVTEDGSLLLYLLVQPVVVQGVLVSGVALRQLLLRILGAERRFRHESQLAAGAEERARLAREMHDTVTKSLYGLAMIAESLPGWVARDPKQAEDYARQLADAARQAVAESRRILVVMRADDLSSRLSETVAESVAAWAARQGREVALEVASTHELGPGTRYEVLAILREALENIARHTGPDDQVEVTLSEDGPWVELTVMDGGSGFVMPADGAVLQRQGHYGLVGMRERAARVGGRLTVSSSPDGTVVRLRVPVPIGASQSNRLSLVDGVH